jgi:hypothetical protein
MKPMNDMRPLSKVIRPGAGLFAIAVLLSCAHETEPDGPNLVDRFGPFNVIQELEASRDVVDFSMGEVVVFTAEFNKNVDWVITITGQNTGAVKTIEGFDRFVSGTKATWEGGVSEVPFFGEEEVLVVLTVPEEAGYADSLTIEITGTKVFEGTLFTDLEDPPGNNIIVRNFQFELDLLRSGRVGANVIPPAQGDFSLALTGTDNVVEDPFVGLVEVYAQIAGSTYLDLPSSIPENTYFNCFIYNDGRPYGIAIFDFVIDANDNGIFDGSDPILAAPEIPVTWTGWRTYNATLADFGVSEADMGRILLARVILISDPVNNTTPREEVQFAVDFMIFTDGAPLDL